MGVRISATGQGFSTSTALPNYNSAYTVMAWVRMFATGSFQALFSLDDGTGSNADVLYASDGNTFAGIWINNGVEEVGATVIDTDRWYHMAMVRESATILKLYVNGKLDAPINTSSVASRAAISNIFVGRAQTGEDLANGVFEHVRLWNIALQRGDILKEMNSPWPVIRPVGSLIRNTTFLTLDDTADQTGTARPWTLAGTPRTGELSPISIDSRRYRATQQANDWALRALALPASGRTGVLSQTLDALTLSSAASLSLNGVLSQSLGSLTLSAAGSVGLNAALSKTLGSLTLASSASVSLNASLSQTLGDLSLTATGTVTNAISGVLSQTLGAATLSSTGSLSLNAVLSQTLGGLTLATAGSLSLDGVLTQSLGALTLASTGALTVSGGLAQSLDALTLVALGSQGSASTGELDVTLGASTLIATATSGAEFSGGFLYEYERHHRARAAAKTQRRKAERKAQKLADAVDREIAALLHASEAKAAKASELERLSQLVARFADAQAEDAFNERTQRAFNAALAEANAQNLALLSQALNEQLEEEEFVVLMALALDD